MQNTEERGSPWAKAVCRPNGVLQQQLGSRRDVPSAVFQKFEEEEVWNESYNYANY